MVKKTALIGVNQCLSKFEYFSVFSVFSVANSVFEAGNELSAGMDVL